MKILIVDDSKAMQNIVTKSMKSIGFIDDSYSYALDGEEALRLIRSSAPDLVLCDMHMPKMTGLELLKALRAEKNKTKVIIISIDDDPKTLSNINAVGADAYLKKPFTSEQLFTTVTTLINKIEEAEAPVQNDFRQLLPPIPVIERVLSSLAAADVKLVEAKLDDIDLERSPFYGGSLIDDRDHIALAMFLDVLAANTIAAIIKHQPLTQALNAARSKQLDMDAKQALLGFLGMFSGLCKPSASGRLLDINAEHIVEDAHAHLENHLRKYRDILAIYSINCGPCQGGKFILFGI